MGWAAAWCVRCGVRRAAAPGANHLSRSPAPAAGSPGPRRHRPGTRRDQRRRRAADADDAYAVKGFNPWSNL